MNSEHAVLIDGIKTKARYLVVGSLDHNERVKIKTSTYPKSNECEVQLMDE